MSELENRLAGLHALPVATLPGAAAARSRGEQRTRRTRVVLGGAIALVAVLAVSGGVALGGGGPERIPPPPAGPGPSADAEAGLSASLLDAEDVAAVRDGEWEVRATEDFPFDPLPAGCGDPATVFGNPAETALRFLDGPETRDGAQTVGHSLKAYADEAEAQAALARVAGSIRSCGESAPGPQVVAGEPASTSTRTYATFTTGTRTVVFAVERIGAVLSGVAIRSFELNDIPPLADAAAEAVAGGAYSASADAPFAGPDHGLLRAQDLAAAGLGAWSVQTLTDPEGGLSECMRGAAGELQRYPAIGGWARLVRAADGALVQQSTARYSGDDQAADDFASHAAAVRACPTEEIEDWPAEPRVVLSVATHEVVEQSPDLVLVRTTYACETCDGRTSYLAVARAGRWLTVLNVLADDEQDAAALAREVVRAATARLAAPQSG